MKFWSSIGFGIVLFILYIAMPKVFHALEDVLLTLLSSITLVLQQSQYILASPASALSVPTVSF